ncbi:MAG: hypothetical protein IJ770_03630 [Alphaproteobacteria bacterium]|nr:hypothetical protein [Alphaproteobacteria bacterium]
MEAPETVLEMFSPLLILEYIRLMSVASYIKHEGQANGVKFKISAADYERLMQEPLKTALIGIETSFANDVLTAVPSEKCLALYEHKVMRESVLQYWDNYGKRYENYIAVIDEN